MFIPMTSVHSKPPLLQTYILPSGPMAAPFGPPPTWAITSFFPSGHTLVRLPVLISTSTTLPSAMATGPSGKPRPSVITLAFCISTRSPFVADRAVSLSRQGNGVAGFGQIDLYDRVDAAPHQPIGLDRELARGDGSHEIVGDAGRDVIVEGALLPVAPQVELERLELDDGVTGHVGDRDGGEVGLAGHGADTRELGRLAPHLVPPAGVRVGDGDQVA